jgi:hypothetical protein
MNFLQERGNDHGRISSQNCKFFAVQGEAISLVVVLLYFTK